MKNDETLVERDWAIKVLPVQYRKVSILYIQAGLQYKPAFKATWKSVHLESR